jgi:hypothetical protein
LSRSFFAVLHRCLTKCPEHRCLIVFLRWCIGCRKARAVRSCAFKHFLEREM